MKKFTQWLENRLLENYQPEFTGILKVRPNPSQLLELQNKITELMPDMKPLSQDKLHVTLLHQNLAKPLKGVQLPPLTTEITFDFNGIYLIEREGKKSIFILVNEQDALKDYMNEIAKMGVQIEPNRVFHVSLTNLTGNPADSVGHKEENSIMNGAQKVQI